MLPAAHNNEHFSSRYLSRSMSISTKKLKKRRESPEQSMAKQDGEKEVSTEFNIPLVLNHIDDCG